VIGRPCCRFRDFEKHLLAGAVLEFRGAALSVAGHALSGFESAIVFQKVRDAGRPRSVRRIVSSAPACLSGRFLVLADA
jgi:hypothetical protein